MVGWSHRFSFGCITASPNLLVAAITRTSATWAKRPAPMKPKTIKLSIEALKKQMKIYAIDANLFDMRLMGTQHGANSSKKRREIQEAIRDLEAETKGKQNEQ